MGTVISLTEAKITELLSTFTGISLTQDEINALITQLWTNQESLDAAMEQLENVTMPQLQEDLAESSIRVSELNDVALVNLQAALDLNAASLQNLDEVTLPALQEDLQNEIDTNAVRPKIYVQPEAPSNPDENDRDLMVGDRWNDEDDDLSEHLWNGTEWVTLTLDIPDLSEEIEQYISPEHAIYHSPVTGSVHVTNGTNITPV